MQLITENQYNEILSKMVEFKVTRRTNPENNTFVENVYNHRTVVVCKTIRPQEIKGEVHQITDYYDLRKKMPK